MNGETKRFLRGDVIVIGPNVVGETDDVGKSGRIHIAGADRSRVELDDHYCWFPNSSLKEHPSPASVSAVEACGTKKQQMQHALETIPPHMKEVFQGIVDSKSSLAASEKVDWKARDKARAIIDCRVESIHDNKETC